MHLCNPLCTYCQIAAAQRAAERDRDRPGLPPRPHVSMIPRRGRGFSTVLAQRPRRAAGPIVAWGSMSHGYVVETPAGTTFTRSPAIAMRLAERAPRLDLVWADR